MFFNNTTYSCSGASYWGNCDNDLKKPKRRSGYIPYTMSKKYPFFPMTFPVRTRALHSFQIKDENGVDLVNKLVYQLSTRFPFFFSTVFLFSRPFKNPPLFNMEFAVIGKLKMSKKEIESVIKKMGGRVVNGIHNKLAAVISNREEVEKMDSKMTEAKAYNIQVISEEFLSEVENIDSFDALRYISSRNLTDWGGNVCVNKKILNERFYKFINFNLLFSQTHV